MAVDSDLLALHDAAMVDPTLRPYVADWLEERGFNEARDVMVWKSPYRHSRSDGFLWLTYLYHDPDHIEYGRWINYDGSEIQITFASHRQYRGDRSKGGMGELIGLGIRYVGSVISVENLIKSRIEELKSGILK